MGVQLIVKMRARLRSQIGSVTAESALALAGLFFVILLLVQSLSLIVVFLQLQSATYEASQIASAFGPVAEQKQRASRFLSTAVPHAKTTIEIQDHTATAIASQRIELLAFGFTIDVKSTAARWDSL